MSALAIPRLRVRRRRKRPKSPDWMFWALCYGVALASLAHDGLKFAGGETSASRALDIGCNVLLACAWRRGMRHADPDDDCATEWGRVFVLWLGGVALAAASLIA